MSSHPVGLKLVILLLFLIQFVFPNVVNGPSYYAHRCSNRLENALEQMLRRSQTKSGSRSTLDLTPYSVYHSIYKTDEINGEDIGVNSNSEEILHKPTILNEKLDSFYEKRNLDVNRKQHNLPVSRVEVADLKVRLPNKSRWVHVDKCQFSAINRTLDTRLSFPDLTISGKVILHPTGGKCNMILRLRRAGIEFRTIPLGVNTEEARRSGTASVRTDSHFSEPGFISVFAHGCQGPSGLKLRQNSKRRNFNYENDFTNTDSTYHRNNRKRPDDSYRSFYHRQDYYNDRYNGHPRYRRSIKYESLTEDLMNFNDEIFEYRDDFVHSRSKARTFADFFSGEGSIQSSDNGYLNNNRFHSNRHKYPNKWHNIANYHQSPDGINASIPPETDDEISEALSSELEHLFSMGVRGLLTTYMQKALQPAIKETLMENMGYTLSYG